MDSSDIHALRLDGFILIVPFDYLQLPILLDVFVIRYFRLAEYTRIA